jgi:hypothetical protein
MRALRFAAVVMAAALTAVAGFAASNGPARANGTATQAYCVPPNTIAPGQPQSAIPVQQNFVFDASCAGQPGDWFTDGPIQNPTITYSGSSFDFTIPALNWIALGTRVYSPLSTQSVIPSTTTYFFLTAATGAWSQSTSNTVPAGTVLEYTVVSNGSGVTSITLPARAQATFYSSTISNLASNGVENLALSGAACDGSTDDKTYVNAALPLTQIPYGTTCFANEGVSQIGGGSRNVSLTGPGRVSINGSGYVGDMSPLTTVFNTAPSPEPSAGNFQPTGDMTGVHLPFMTYVFGSCTAGCVTSGYTYAPALSGIYGLYKNFSGQDGTGSYDRTMVAGSLIDLSNAGHGDTCAYCARVQVANAGSGEADLGAPATSIIDGQIQGLQYDYLDTQEYAVSDNGNDLTAVGIVLNMDRTNATGGEYGHWEGIVVQNSQETVAVDSGYDLQGEFTVGIDMAELAVNSYTGSGGTFTSGTAGVALAPNLPIWFNVTRNGSCPAGSCSNTRWDQFNDGEVLYSTTDTALDIVMDGGTKKFSFADSGTFTAPAIVSSGTVTGTGLVTTGASALSASTALSLLANSASVSSSTAWVIQSTDATNCTSSNGSNFVLAVENAAASKNFDVACNGAVTVSNTLNVAGNIADSVANAVLSNSATISSGNEAWKIHSGDATNCIGSSTGSYIAIMTNGTPTTTSTFDCAGDIAARSEIEAASTQGGTQSYVAPVYTSGGSAVASTQHSINYSCAFSSSTTCAVTLTGSNTGQFTSATSYSCSSPSQGSSTTTTGPPYWIGNQSSSGFTVYATSSNSLTVYGTCTGT